MNKVTVELTEWEQKNPEKGNELFNYFFEDEEARKKADYLTGQHILNIVELKNGIKIAAYSYVGRIRIGNLKINIRPKIKGMKLYKLLKYAYGLRDITLFSETLHGIDNFPFCDILIYQLCIEAEELILRGMTRKYVQFSDDLNIPRGRIDFKKLAGQISSSTLPCSFFKRSDDHLLNRVLLAGLKAGIRLTEDLTLKIKLHRLCSIMEESVKSQEINRDILLRASAHIDRLNEKYGHALEIIKILYESQGIQPEDGSHIRIHGFFFDMNRFFQALISRLLHDFLEGYKIQDERRLYDMFSYSPEYNPWEKKSPVLKPDFSVMEGKKVKCFLDAKYKDLWNNQLPAYMLYQLAIYAVSGEGNHRSRILYPVTDGSEAKVQKIDIKNLAGGDRYGQVILQPVDLDKLVVLLDESKKDRRKIKDYISKIVL